MVIKRFCYLNAYMNIVWMIARLRATNWLFLMQLTVDILCLFNVYLFILVLRLKDLTNYVKLIEHHLFSIIVDFCHLILIYILQSSDLLTIQITVKPSVWNEISTVMKINFLKVHYLQYYCTTLKIFSIFFSVNTYFQGLINQSHETTIQFVKTLDEFRKNLNNRFMSYEWLDAIDFTKFVIIGDCVVSALCESPFPDYKEQEVNLIAINMGFLEFEAAIEHVIDILETRNLEHAKRQKTSDSGNTKRQIKVEKVPGSLNYDVFLPCGIKLNFVHRSTSNSKVGLSSILHNFDMDICQLAFTGSSFYCRNSYLLKSHIFH